MSIVILNWNVADLLSDCLSSLPSACGDWWADTEVIVVDNASTDDSVAVVREQFPHVRLIALPRNAGFSAGNNVGIRASKGNYVLLLNPDTVCLPSSISRLCLYIEAHSEVGIAGPRLLNTDGSLQPSRRRFPTFKTGLLEATPLQPMFTSSPIIRGFYMEDLPDNTAQSVGWLSGAALLCRRETLRQVGLFDTGYFMFSEEVDLCRRAHKAGWRIAYLPDSQITHFGGQSTDQAVASRHIDFNTSKARYFRKHHGPLAGNLLRLYLLGTYAAQSISEGAKWLLGHKRPLRAARLRLYARVLRSGLRPHHAMPAGSLVLLITGEFPPARGGVGDYTCRLLQALHSEGSAARVLTRLSSDDRRPTTDDRTGTDDGRWTMEDGGQAAASNRPYVSPRRLHAPVVGGRWSVVGRLATTALPLLTPHITFRPVFRALRGTRSTVAHIQYQTGAYEMRPAVNLLPLFLRLLWGRPTIVTFHDLLVPYLFPKAGPVREWANRLLARSASAVVATNPDDFARLKSWGVHHVELIPIGSNIPNNPPPDFNRDLWRADHGVAPETTLLAYFGFLNSTKGIDDLLRALALLNPRARESGSTGIPRFRLMMVGGGLGSSDPTNRETAASLDALAQQLGIDDLLLWTGFLPSREVSAALLSADMAVLPYAGGASFRRGSLLAVLEHTLPLITTQPASAPPQARDAHLSWPSLEHGKNAFLVPSADAHLLAAAIERLAADQAQRLKLSAGSRDLARFFDWERIAEMHRTLYNSAVLAPE